ncbi:MAG: efflux RND transporter periplasmic adaptor subunit [Bryobacterales bacterium]|nr:efflux RND transporter periplasmic adaptor subunit [Bryobacterales bacterium]
MTASLLLAALSCADAGVEVRAERPLRRDIESAVTTNGRIEAFSRSEVRVAVAGRVERVLVHRGDTVEEGQELLRLSDTGQAGALAQAAARLRGAKARLATLEAGLAPSKKATLRAEREKLAIRKAKASLDLERLERLAARGAVPRLDADAKRRLVEDLAIDLDSIDAQLASPLAEGQRDAARAAVDEAASAVSLARRATEELRVVAPSSGVVYSLPVAEADYLQGGDLAAHVGVLNPVRARIFVDEPDLGRVRQGSAVTIDADAYPGLEWTCLVDRLATEVVEMDARRVGEIHCTVANHSGRLLPNLAVGARIVTERVQSALSVSRLAVMRSDGRAHVWAVDGGKASRREILTGAEGPLFVEVRDGLGESEVVLLPGDDSLSEGRIVSPQLQGDGGAG